MSIAWGFYRVAAPALGALAPAASLFSPPEERRLWPERLGRVHGAGACAAWIHAASLGESSGAAPLAEALLGARPGATLRLSATTLTGRARLAEVAARLAPPAAVSLAPFDAPQVVRRFFSAVEPGRLFVLETELWPHWLLEARSRRVPVAVLSARLSGPSVAGYRRLGPTFRGLVAGLDAVSCQSDEDRARWIALGARPERADVLVNLKDDGLPAAPPDRAAVRAALGLDPEAPLLVLGSLRPGEVEPLARAWQALPTALRRRWRVIAVPRHLRAASELAAEAARAWQAVARSGGPSEGAWGWVERAGVLNAYYAAADVAFVGGSLRPYGGHNPLEPAASGAAVIMGPYYGSQLDAVRALRERDGIWIAASAQELVLALRGLLGDAALRAAHVAAGLELVARRRGVAGRVVARLAELGLWGPV